MKQQMHSLDGIRASLNSARWGIKRTIPVRSIAKWKWQLDRKMLAFLICQQDGLVRIGGTDRISVLTGNISV